MALHKIHDHEVCAQLRPGDVVFSYLPLAKYPLHAAVFVGEKCEVSATSCRIQANGVPHSPNAAPSILNLAIWGEPDEYHVDIVGQRLDLDPLKVQEVALLSQTHLRELSRIGTTCEFHKNKKKVRDDLKIDGNPILVQSNCAQYVEWLYECAGIDLVGPDVRPDQRADYVHPSTQIHAFWRGTYPLTIAWDERLRTYPACTFGNRSTTD